MIRLVRSSTLRKLQEDRDRLRLKARGDAKRIDQLVLTARMLIDENRALHAALSLHREP